MSSDKQGGKYVIDEYIDNNVFIPIRESSLGASRRIESSSIESPASSASSASSHSVDSIDSSTILSITNSDIKPNSLHHLEKDIAQLKNQLIVLEKARSSLLADSAQIPNFGSQVAAEFLTNFT